MARLDDILRTLGTGRRVPIATRQQGGLGDPMTQFGAQILHGDDLAPIDVRDPSAKELRFAPAIDAAFDMGKMIPFVSSNVEGGYFNAYEIGSAGEHQGDLYLLFQKRRPETPEGKPIGGPRAYVYQNVPRYVWESLLASSSPGGVVWDVIRRGGIEGDQI